MISSIPDVKAWTEQRLVQHRKKLESFGASEIETNMLRARIAECNELLAALSNTAPQALSFASEI